MANVSTEAAVNVSDYRKNRAKTLAKVAGALSGQWVLLSGDGKKVICSNHDPKVLIELLKTTGAQLGNVHLTQVPVPDDEGMPLGGLEHP